MPVGLRSWRSGYCPPSGCTPPGSGRNQPEPRHSMDDARATQKTLARKFRTQTHLTRTVNVHVHLYMHVYMYI